MAGWLYLVGYIIFLGIGTFWQKASLKFLTPYQLHLLIALGMFVVGLPAFWYFQKAPFVPNKSAVALGLGVGLLFSTGSLFFTLALSKLPAGTATVISLAYVIVVIGLSALFLNEQLTFQKVIGIVLTLIGVSLLYK